MICSFHNSFSLDRVPILDWKILMHCHLTVRLPTRWVENFSRWVENFSRWVENFFARAQMWRQDTRLWQPLHHIDARVCTLHSFMSNLIQTSFLVIARKQVIKNKFLSIKLPWKRSKQNFDYGQALRMDRYWELLQSITCCRRSHNCNLSGSNVNDVSERNEKKCNSQMHQDQGAILKALAINPPWLSPMSSFYHLM